MSIHLRSKLGDLPFDVWCVCVTTLISRTGTTALVFLVVYLSSLGISEVQAGFAVSVYGIGGLIAAPVTGYACDRLGSLTVMKIALFAQGFILLVIPFASNFKYVLCLILFWSLTGEAFRPASSAFIASLSDGKSRGFAFALNRIATNLGMSIGPGLTGLLIDVKPASIFFLNGVASILSGGFLSYFSRGKCFERVPSVHRDVRASKVSQLVLFSIALIPAFCAFYQYRSTMAQYLLERQILEPRFFGLLLSVNAVLVLILQIPLALYLQKGHERISIVVGAFLVGTGFGAFIFTMNFLGAALCVIVWTLGQIALLSGSEAYVSKIANEANQGQFLGLYHLAINFAAFIGPGLGSLILVHSATMLWGTMFMFGSFSAIVLLRVTRQNKTTRTQRVSNTNTSPTITITVAQVCGIRGGGGGGFVGG